MPLYEKIIDDVLNRKDKELGTIGSETMSNIGSFVQDQYERIPEDKREGFEQGVSEVATGIQEWNKNRREVSPSRMGPLDPFILAGKAYNTVATPIKEQISKETGLAPSVIEAGEIALDIATPFIPLTVRKAEEVVNTIFNKSRRLSDWGKRTAGDAQYLFGGGVGTGTGVGGKALRSQQSKLTKGMVYDSTIELGGSTVEAKKIWQLQSKNLNDIKKTVSLLNEMYRTWEPGTRIAIRNNKLSFIPRTNLNPGGVAKYKNSWQFDKDHIRAVVNQFGPMKGADMAENLEIVFGALNRKKSNVFQLPEEILEQLAVPKNLDEFVFKQLHPEYAQLQNKLPNRWKESFTKNILNDYYEKLYGSAIYKPGMEPIVSKKKWPAIMKRLVKKYKHVYSDKNLLKQLEEMESIPFWKRIKPNEIPRWAQTLDMPPSPKDPFWLNMPPKSQQRWKTMVKDKYRLRDSPLPHERGLRVEGSKEKYYK